MPDRSAQVDIHIRLKCMCCVSSGFITTLTRYPLWYSTYHYTSYSRRSPLWADPHPISLLGPLLNCTPVINPRCACAARVTVVVLCVCMYVCMYVCVYVICVCVSTHTCHLTHWNHKREIPTDSAQYRDRFKFCRFS